MSFQVDLRVDGDSISVPLRGGKERDNDKPPCFAEERPGWKGYIEWEKYPDKQKEAQEILAKYGFAKVWDPSSELVLLQSLHAIKNAL